MEFLDRTDEIAELKRVLNTATPAKFVVVYGRRRLGKSTLIKRVLSADDIYYMAGDLVDNVQLEMLQELLSQKFPEIGMAKFSGWEELLLMLNRLTDQQFTLCLDEFPYMVKHSPELPSILQRILDSKTLKYNLIICGSSQRMMQEMILSQSEPLYGRADAILDVRPIPLPFLQKGLHIDAISTIEEYSVWGGVPRYWELREEYASLKEAIRGMMLGTTTVLYDEPKKLFLDDMKATVQSESLMAVIAGGANRLSEIASRMGREATSLSAPLDKLIQMTYIRREIPFGDSPKKSKKGIYRINDPMMDFYYSFIMPNISNLARGRKAIVMEEIERDFTGYVSLHWEHLCREAISGNMMFGHRWSEAKRWWGTVPNEEKGSFREMEFDVIAESTDGNALLIGECKWTNPEIASELHRKLLDKANRLPFAKGKEIIAVLFLKNKPKDAPSPINILYPEDIIQAMLGD
ncbi:MAG: ATP-binding protein [Bacteroides sp.]|nr:ATP-binding protein [Bacteroides sp.]MCM1389967.1 ATP-binding protein [Bacteroides sp.]